jgi:1,4-dihydroxy-2-naphthoate octaprenyltransferase
MAEHQRINLLRHIRPVHLLTTLALFLLGTGIARYLGQRINFTNFLLGIIWMTFLQLGFFFLGDHFRSPFDIGLYNRLLKRPEDNAAEQYQPAEIVLYISVSFLTAAALGSILLGFQGAVNMSTAVLMGLYFIGFIILVVPGVSLDLSGIGEIITSLTLVLLPPAFAFFLQFGEFHRFLAYAIFPLFPLHLAMIIMFRLVGYSEDIWQRRKTILVRIGWKQGVFLHNLSIFSGFILFGIAILFGFPIRLTRFVFLTLPAALFLIWSLSRLEDGAPVQWQLFTMLSLVVFFLPVYLISWSSWMH